MEIDREWVEDSVLIGNYNVPISYLRLSIRKHTLLSADEKEALLRDLEAFHSRLLGLVHPRTFKDGGLP